MSGATTRGVLFVHSAPRALVPHIEWAAGGVLGVRASFDWTSQPVAPGCLRAEYSWQAPQGSGALLASALRGWSHLRFEVTEEASQGCDGGRWSHTPALGIFHAVTDVHGNVQVPEDRVRAALELLQSPVADPEAARRVLSLAVGEAWDSELEAFRHAGDDTPVRWLHQVG
ncbi:MULTISPECIES: DUF3145 domain-containing protein [Kineococcus]|uniref:DUF3145 domain-containing protein n=1 Tax=Kineococcus TaxID=33981 RepID=UPI001412A34B|nr:DUF3145 domain-containing protein [Kineococcus vitellinus]NAZ77776.1 DUF3145 family protein [Kineococcus vitellinus]